MDDHTPMPDHLDDWLYALLSPLCGPLTFSAMDAAWEAVIGVLTAHALDEATRATQRAVRIDAALDRIDAAALRRAIEANDA